MKRYETFQNQRGAGCRRLPSTFIQATRNEISNQLSTATVIQIDNQIPTNYSWLKRIKFPSPFD